MSNASTIHVVDEEVTGAILCWMNKVLCLYFLGYTKSYVCIFGINKVLCFFGMNKAPCLYLWDRQSSMCEFSDYNLNNDNHGYVDDVDDPRHD